MTAWVAWRLVKFLAVALFTGGVVGALSTTVRARRLAMAYALGFPGLALTWMSGWMLMKGLDLSMTEPWIQLSMLASLFSFSAAVQWGLSSARWAAMLAAGGLSATLALMVIRPESPIPVLLLGALPGIFALAAPTTRDHDDGGWVRRGFKWVAWAEGVSLIAMLGISMPLRVIFDIDLDGDSGVIGWMHGVMVMVYSAVLVVTAKAEGWSLGRAALGWFASFLPFGTFVFEWRLDR
jgi:integral membrane protein